VQEIERLPVAREGRRGVGGTVRGGRWWERGERRPN